MRNQLPTESRLTVTAAEIYDTSGAAYPARSLDVGGRVSGASMRRPRPAIATVPGDTPVQVTVTFTDLARGKKKASRLVVHLGGGEDGDEEIEIGPFPLARD